MYNSILINLIMKLVTRLKNYYQYSLIKKVASKIRSTFKRLSKSSSFMNIISRKEYLGETKLYFFYKKLISGLNKSFKTINKKLGRFSKTSLVLGLYNYPVEDKTSLLDSIIIVLSGFSLVFAVYSQMVLKLSFIYFVIAFALAFILRQVEVKYVEKAFKESFIFKAIGSLFTIDEGGGEWW